VPFLIDRAEIRLRKREKEREKRKGTASKGSDKNAEGSGWDRFYPILHDGLTLQAKYIPVTEGRYFA